MTKKETHIDKLRGTDDNEISVLKRPNLSIFEFLEEDQVNRSIFEFEGCEK